MRILRAVTNDYIDTAEPVGSRTLAKKYALGVSPATIRNEMADLEESGYLQQPHTSAGRIPSDKGYRFYVDELMDRHCWTQEQKAVLRHEIETRRHAIEDMIHHTARILAWLTDQIALVLAPNLSNASFRHVQYIQLDPQSVLIVMVLDPGFVQNRLVRLAGPITQEDLMRITNFCNTRLVGISVADVGRSLISELRDVIVDGALFEATLDLLHRGLARTRAERVYMDGSVNLLNHPEFRDVERARALLEVLEDTETMMEILEEASGSSGLVVQIGQENKREEIKDCSIINATYSIGGETIGTIGILGPTRMDYGKITSVVEEVATALSELLSNRPSIRII